MSRLMQGEGLKPQRAYLNCLLAGRDLLPPDYWEQPAGDADVRLIGCSVVLSGRRTSVTETHRSGLPWLTESSRLAQDDRE